MRRYRLKDRTVKDLLADLATRLNVDFGALPTRLDVLTVDSKVRLYLSGDGPLFLQIRDDVIPTLLNSQVLTRLPTLTVDSGAVPYICNGANLMAPGVVKLDGEFSTGDLVAIREEKYGKFLALGRARYSSTETRAQKTGVVADNVHFVGDRHWNTYKSLKAH